MDRRAGMQAGGRACRREGRYADGKVEIRQIGRQAGRQPGGQASRWEGGKAGS